MTTKTTRAAPRAARPATKKAAPAARATAAAKTANRSAKARPAAAAATPAPELDEPTIASPATDTPDAPSDRDAAKSRTRWVRQSCRLTQAEYTQLSALKKRAATLARPVKRGRLLRAGLHSLLCMSDEELFSLLDSLPADSSD